MSYIFHSSYTVLCSHQHCIRVLASPCLHRILFLGVLSFIADFLMGGLFLCVCVCIFFNSELESYVPQIVEASLLHSFSFASTVVLFHSSVLNLIYDKVSAWVPLPHVQYEFRSHICEWYRTRIQFLPGNFFHSQSQMQDFLFSQLVSCFYFSFHGWSSPFCFLIYAQFHLVLD